MRVQKVSHLFALLKASRHQRLSNRQLQEQGILLDIKRDDELHPIISGNKWRKLKHILLEIESHGYRHIASMGGQYSNMLHTLSYITMLLGWKVHLYVRGHKAQKPTPMLQDAKRWGAKISFIDRITFRQIRETPPLLGDDVFWLSEGGFDQLALKGTMESLMELPTEYDYLVVASATGTSLAGFCQGASKMSLNTKMVGIAVLNNASQIMQKVDQITDGKVVPTVISGYEFGGYAKKTPELLSFINKFENEYPLSLEPVYSGKSFYAAMDLIKQGYFPQGSKILLIHCGGLQGKREHK